ncbi:MAG: di-trans,poly-cis-decaprenylcistransferase [Clostridiales bacterium]|nr:di-trans,poly-cis-decaprenylcistransferase [Clostridiales bacterium]
MNIPEHIAIIMDGNRRWAKKKSLPIKLGHKNGAEALRKIVEYSKQIGVKYLTVYAFSTENWKRSKEEVDDLMNLLREYLGKIEEDIAGKNIRAKIIGDKKRLDLDIQEKIRELEEKTKDCTALTFQIALNYGGRDEIVNAVNSIINDNVKEISEEIFERYLYTVNAPDPDLIIRTAGEKRISGFLLWQCAYSEFVWTDVLWPDFNEKDLDIAIEEFNKRIRKFGAN